MNDFFTMIKKYRFEYLPKQKGYSENTIISYRRALTLFVNYLHEIRKIPIENIDFPIIERDLVVGFLEWLQKDRNCSATTRNQRLMVLRSFFKYAGKVDCSFTAASLVVANIPKKNEPGKMVDYLSENAFEAFLQQPNTESAKGVRDLFFIILMYDTAARCGELQKLRIKDIHLDGPDPVIYLHGKGDKGQMLPLFKRTVEHYLEYKKVFHPDTPDNSDDLVFYTVSHGERHPISPDAVALFFNKYAKAAHAVCPECPEKIHPHMIRHTRAMHLYQKRMPLALISEVLRHADVKTTRIYAFADPEMKRNEMEKASPLKKVGTKAIPIWENDEEMILKLCGLE